MTLAQGEYCSENGYDPQDPPCPRLILSGSISKIEADSAEENFAKEALFTRHPSMANWPSAQCLRSEKKVHFGFEAKFWVKISSEYSHTLF